MDPDTLQRLTEYLSDFVTEERLETISRVLDRRSRFLTVVLEDIYQPHNASAVLRSCDCFGIQDVHIIENRHDFDPSSGVTIGADQWLTMKNYKEEGVNNTEVCFKRLREEGYRIVATTPHTDDVSIDKLPLDQKTALVFGAELDGISDYAMEHADAHVQIPMFGFSESYNISVSAALCLYECSLRMRESSDIAWALSEEEKAELRLEWLEKSIRASDQLKQKFFEGET